MKRVAELLSRTVSTFGITAVAASVAYMFWSGAAITSDDSYIIGLCAGIVVATILLVALLCERAWTKKASLRVLAALYVLLAVVATFAMLTGELHGPGMAAVILGGSLLLGILEFRLLRRIPSLYFNAFGLPMAVAFVALFMGVR